MIYIWVVVYLGAGMYNWVVKLQYFWKLHLENWGR